MIGRADLDGGNTEAEQHRVAISSPLGWETAVDRIRRSSIDKPAQQRWTPKGVLCARVLVWVCVWQDLSHLSASAAAAVHQWLALGWGSDA